jgi:predicted DNA-binding transcriptional regulator YafY
MGRRSAADIPAKIILAFLDQPTWRQDELAKRCDVETRTIRERMKEMVLNGYAFHYEDEAPHVYWSVKTDWIPGAATFSGEDVSRLLRMLLRVPQSGERDGLVRRVVGVLPRTVRPQVLMDAMASPAMGDRDERVMARMLDSRIDRQSLRIRYVSLRSEDAKWRHISVQRVFPTVPVRVAAWCHLHSELRWFRCDRVEEALVDDTVAWRLVEPQTLREFVDQSVHGYHSSTAVRNVFVVRDPVAKWARSNLPDASQVQYSVTDVLDGIRVEVFTAVDLVARYVVGLGDAATAESPELREAVETIARGALTGSRFGGEQNSAGGGSYVHKELEEKKS